MENEVLISYAKKAMGNAYAPYSGFSVGAALLTTEGEVFTGCNVENASFGATICAERCAMIKAVSEGYTSFEKIAIVSSSNNITYPCGVCRQFLSEFMDEDSTIVLIDDNDEIKEYSLGCLIPFAFNLSKDDNGYNDF
jgi:cytidine deaminase